MSRIPADSRDLNTNFNSDIDKNIKNENVLTINKQVGTVTRYTIKDNKGVLISDKPLGAICGFVNVGPMGRFEYDNEKENNW